MVGLKIDGQARGMKVFDNFTVGGYLGEDEMQVEGPMLSGWAQLFPDSGSTDQLPPGLVVVVAMRAYTNVVTPRPPGNVHGAQEFELSRLPRVGERLNTRVTCVGKEVRRERRWVSFLTETTGEDGELCFRGRMAIAWAA